MFRLGDLVYLFKRTKDNSVNVYRQNSTKTQQVIRRIVTINDNFSESLFTSWLGNIFLRYILYCSNESNKDKLERFEKVHISQDNIKWHEVLNLYYKFDDISVRFIDFTNFIHTKNNDIITLKICLVCTSKGKNEETLNTIGESQINYYTVEMIKKNEVSKDDKKIANYTSNCPNCGAPTNITTFGICDHCQEMVSIYDNVWKIRKIELDR
jgi:hypothetical protein